MMPQHRLNPENSVKVLVVDDEVHIVNFISDALSSHGYDVFPFTSPEEACKCMPDFKCDLALIDINMPTVNGETVSKAFLQHNPGAEIIIITGVPDEKNLDPCLKLGLTHFLFKPFNESQLRYTVYAALHFQRLRRSYISSANNSKDSKYIGISQSVRMIRKSIASASQIDLPVLITGESGTGKEIIAHEVHRFSNRQKKLFLPINCAMLGNLADSELFGHAQGAFTGAKSATKGHVGTVESGTLFLDEIGELALDIQAKLLRFLDSGEYIRVGESTIRKADIRIVAATNRNLEQYCKDHHFREDLFYRLSGSTIQTEPLSKRKEDIIPLLWFFLAEFGSSENTTYEITPQACELLVEQDWPGNVRQLKLLLFKLSKLSFNGKITSQDVRSILGEKVESKHLPFKEAKQKAVEEFERRYLLKTLQISQGRLKEALTLSGMHKKNFYTKINKLGLFLKDFNPGRK